METQPLLSFASDYIEGAHPDILRRFAETAMEQLTGYGTDRYCASAAEKIRAACRCPGAQVSFLAGGTQTNQLTIDALLRPYEGVVAAETGHIAVHEAGAIEATGHKVLTLPQREGKLAAETLADYLRAFDANGDRDHMVFPGMVYISHPTELGTLYSLAELTALSRVCREHQIPLYLDGARLGYGLMSRAAELDLPAIAALCDAFYIGGTKVGALCGEALVFPRSCPPHLTTLIKRRGALLAKGWVTGLQFDTLFTDGLYLRLGRHAIDMAERLKAGLREKGCRFWLDSPTNQQFLILENHRVEALAKQVRFSVWEPYDREHTVIRLVTSWATRPENVDQLLSLL